VRFNQKGNWIASGDEKGNVFVWESWGTIPVRQKLENVTLGAVRDLAWYSFNLIEKN
jgi:hypothetical protein